MSKTTPPDAPPRGRPDPDGAGPGRLSVPRIRGGLRAQQHSMANLLLGTILADRYRLLSRIGEGAMGWVYLAEHVEIGKKVVAKVLRPSLCRVPEAVSRFRREARAATTIGSRHIVDVTDFGTTEDGSVFFVMEYLEGGEDLSASLKRERFLPWRTVVHILRQQCEALQAAHDAGIIHRDVKPANFYRFEFEGDPNFIKILDFGIARLANPKDSIVTQTGVVMGTPDYMAPEQAMGKHVDHRADIYSLGASAYALLTGRPPFQGANEYDVIYKQLNDDPDPPTQVAPAAAKVPAWLDPIILRSLRKNPEQRFASMKEMADAFAQGMAGHHKAPITPSSHRSDAPDPNVSSAASCGSTKRAGPPTWVWFVAGALVASGIGYALVATG